MPTSRTPNESTNAGRRWYRGDFHAHTNCSDGFHAPADLIPLAQRAGLDFFTITDHNGTEAFAKLAPLPGMLVLRGIEVTFSDGHFNAYGTDNQLEWMNSLCRGQLEIERLAEPYDTKSELMRQMAARGLINSLNHPYLTPYHWQDRGTDLRNLTCFEICNDPHFPANKVANREALATWSEMLSAGHRLTAIGGSDYHRPTPWPEDNKPAEQLGLPSTFVLADELSAEAIFTAIRGRHAYVSLGPQVSVAAGLNGMRYEIGDDLGDVEDEVVFRAEVSAAPEGARVQWVANGQVVGEAGVEDGRGRADYRVHARRSESRWHRVDVRDGDGKLLVVTNPFFTGPAPTPTLHRFGDFVRRTAA